MNDKFQSQQLLLLKKKSYYKYQNTIKEQDLKYLADLRQASNYSFVICPVHESKLMLDKMEICVMKKLENNNNSSVVVNTKEKESAEKTKESLVAVNITNGDELLVPGLSSASAPLSFFNNSENMQKNCASVRVFIQELPAVGSFSEPNAEKKVTKPSPRILIGEKKFFLDDKEFVVSGCKDLTVVLRDESKLLYYVLVNHRDVFDSPESRIILQKNISYVFSIECVNCALLTSFTSFDDLFKWNETDREFDVVKTCRGKFWVPNGNNNKAFPYFSEEDFHFSISDVTMSGSNNNDVEDAQKSKSISSSLLLNYPLLMSTDNNNDDDDDEYKTYFCGTISYEFLMDNTREMNIHVCKSLKSKFIA